MNDKTKTARPLPTAEEVRAVLDYDPATGVFRWLKAAGRCRAGAVAGGCDGKGYILIKIDSRLHKAHRLAWLLTRGTWPRGHLDHIDGQRSNNAIANLREVTNAENGQNRAKQRRPVSSKYLGVSWKKTKGCWVASIRLAYKHRHLGCFDTQEGAYAAYLAAKAQLHTAQPVPRASAYDR